MLTLPKEVTVGETIDPRKLMIFGRIKTGKTSVAMQLPNSLLIDLEGGAITYSGRKLSLEDVKKQYFKKNEVQLTNLQSYLYLCSQIKQQTLDGTINYEHIILDNTTRLESLAKQLALQRYKETGVGKNFKGTDIYALPKGAGYFYVRSAFIDLYNLLIGCYSKSLVLIAHEKPSSIAKEGTEGISIIELNLTGQLKTVIPADMDAIGFLRRSEDGTHNLLDFRRNTTMLSTGSRCPHLRDACVKISEFTPEGEFKTYWNEVYKNI